MTNNKIYSDAEIRQLLAKTTDNLIENLKSKNEVLEKKNRDFKLKIFQLEKEIKEIHQLKNSQELPKYLSN